MTNEPGVLPKDALSSQSLPLGKETARIIRISAALSLFFGMIFFAYSVYGGAFLDGGSTQIFKGVACLLLVLASCSIIEKITLEKQE